MKKPIAIVAAFVASSSSAASSWKIETGGIATTTASPTLLASPEENLLLQEERRRPPNTSDPDYFHPSARGGRAQGPGDDGVVAFVALVPTTNPTRFESVDVPPLELRAGYFLKENVIQEYVVPGDGQSGPYDQVVRIKAWGAGGGGCDGGRGEATEPLSEVDEDGALWFCEGSAGGYVEAAFRLPVGSRLEIAVGGGGKSYGSLPNSLGGGGGYNGGYPGKDDGTSGGGGGGGMTLVSWNGTVLAAAFGGAGGGNTTYCSAAGGVGASLRGRANNTGGYINFDLALQDRDLEEVSESPGLPAILSLSHDSARFTWSPGSHRSKEAYVQKFTVRLSEGSRVKDSREIICSGEYKLHEHQRRSLNVDQNHTTTLTGLKAMSYYCVRIVSFSAEGLMLSDHILPFQTDAAPINQWLPVTVRQSASDISMESAIERGGSPHTRCERSSSQPSGRRGHSVTVVNNEVFIFGGATLECACELDATRGEERCTSRNVFSDELWHFDPFSSIFTLFERSTSPTDLWPQGREQHSATVLPDDGHGHVLIVVGGVSSPDGNMEIGEKVEHLSDVWQLRDPLRILSYSFSSGEGAEETLIPGRISSHQLSLSLQEESDEDMCIVDIQVVISIDHSCLKAIEYIKLEWDGTAPELQSRKYETKVFVRNSESRGKECQSSSLNLIFSDKAKEWVLSHNSIPTSGTFRPASSLGGAFGGLPVDGEWKLSIAISESTHPEEFFGTLLGWELKINAKPCAPRARWERLADPPAEFSPRRLHNAVAVDDRLFISGGFSHRRFDDLWRFDHRSGAWTELKSSMEARWPLHGQGAFLGDFGLLKWGGIAKHGHLEQGQDLWVLDFFQNEWEPVPISNATSGEGQSNARIPHVRYLSGIVFLNDVDTIYEGYNGIGKVLMAAVFGGDGGYLHNTYADSYGFIPNTLFDDVWKLSAAELGIRSTMYCRRQEDYCDWRWIPSSSALQNWMHACGWDGSTGADREECRLQDVLIAAWCRGQYQSMWL
ncbi:hypothetical protein ACHAWF_011710 [Thalassiosira exigua]